MTENYRNFAQKHRHLAKKYRGLMQKGNRIFWATEYRKLAIVTPVFFVGAYVFYC